MIVTVPALISAVTLVAVRRNGRQMDTLGSPTAGEYIETTSRAVINHGTQLNELRRDLDEHITKSEPMLSEHRARLADLQATLEAHVTTEEPILFESRARLGDLQETVDAHMEEDRKFFSDINEKLGIDKGADQSEATAPPTEQGSSSE